VDERRVRGAQSSLDVDRAEPDASDVVLALGGRRAERALDDALHAALQGRRVPLARRHLHRPTHLHLRDELIIPARLGPMSHLQFYRATKLQCATAHVAHCDKSHKQTKQTRLLVTDDDIIAISFIPLNKLRV